MNQIFWQELTELLQVLAPIIIAVVAMFLMWKQTGSVSQAFDKFTERIVNNADVTAGLEKRYDALPDSKKMPVDLALDVIKWWVTLSPSERDNVWADWADEIRNGDPVDDTNPVNVELRDIPFKPVPFIHDDLQDLNDEVAKG